MKAAAPIGNTGTLRSGPRKTPNVVKLFLARDIAKTAKTPPRSPHEEQKTEGEEGKKKKKNWTATFTSANYLEPSRPRPFRAAREGCRGDPPPPNPRLFPTTSATAQDGRSRGEADPRSAVSGQQTKHGVRAPDALFANAQRKGYLTSPRRSSQVGQSRQSCTHISPHE